MTEYVAYLIFPGPVTASLLIIIVVIFIIAAIIIFGACISIVPISAVIIIIITANVGTLSVGSSITLTGVILTVGYLSQLEE